EGPPTGGSGLSTTQQGGSVMTKTILAKKAGLDSKVAITPAQFYLSPHLAAYPPRRVHRAVPFRRSWRDDSSQARDRRPYERTGLPASGRTRTSAGRLPQCFPRD